MNLLEHQYDMSVLEKLRLSGRDDFLVRNLQQRLEWRIKQYKAQYEPTSRSICKSEKIAEKVGSKANIFRLAGKIACGFKAFFGKYWNIDCQYNLSIPRISGKKGCNLQGVTK